MKLVSAKGQVIKVGHILTDKITRWKIISIVCQAINASEILSSGSLNKTQYFGDLNNDLTPSDGWANNWFIEEEETVEVVPVVVKSSSTNQMDDLTFFKSVAAGNCPCNIPRQVCSYHQK
jgi:hypothetical protein